MLEENGFTSAKGKQIGVDFCGTSSQLTLGRLNHLSSGTPATYWEYTEISIFSF